MKKPATITIDGKRHLWRDVLALRRAQLEEAKRPDQPALFELKADSRPKQGRTAAGRYAEPTLFERLR
jgi:hypothetical protein